MKYLVEEVGDDLLVYDLEQHRAYVLDPKEREQWNRVRGIVARRAFLATVAATILVPTVAQAASKCGATAVTTCLKGEHGLPCEKSDGTCGHCAARMCR